VAPRVLTIELGQYHCSFPFYLICLLFLNKMVVRHGEQKAECISSYIEGSSDVAVLEAMLKSSQQQSVPVQGILTDLK
jgi:hypothetical protein